MRNKSKLSAYKTNYWSDDDDDDDVDDESSMLYDGSTYKRKINKL